jgi:tripartite ATP-independent transporter DctM subunit
MGLRRGLGACVGTLATIAVLAEVAILSLGVVARYVFDHPFVWTDELASIVFLWLAMLGAVLALQRGEHMRLTSAVGMLPRAARPWGEALAIAAPAVLLLILLPPAWNYAMGQWAVLTPALGLPDAVRALALPVGFGLMLLDCLARLRAHAMRHLLGVLVVLALVGLALWAGRDQIGEIGNWNLLIYFALLLGAGVLLGVPIAFAFSLCTAAYLVLVAEMPLTVVMGRMDEGMSSLMLLAVPLFVLLGQLIEMTGMAKAMIDFLASALGHIRGGLSYVLLGAILLISGISGSKAADMAAVAPVLFPEMRRRGVHEGELVSILAASGAMSETIPPSLVIITIGSVTSVSIAALFRGGLLPGIIMALALAVVARWRTGRDMPAGIKRAPMRQVLRTFIIAVPALILPFVIRAAVVDGVTTATEVSTIGIVYAVLIGLLVYRKFDWGAVYPILVQSASLSGSILLIIGAATAMAWALTQSGFSTDLATAMAAAPGGKAGFLAISIMVFIVLGSVLEGIPAMVLFGPLLFPAATEAGVNEVHYAMVAILAMGIGLFAPPFGLGYYAACTISRVHPDVGMRRVWPYLFALVVGLIVVAAVPWISTSG